MSPRFRIRLAAIVVLLSPGAARAQQPAPPDSLHLETLMADALRADPRGRQAQLLDAQSDLRLRNLAAERLPAFSVDGLAQHQSDVVTLPIALPGGQRPPSPPHDTYDARAAAQLSLLDPSLGPRTAVERAQRDEADAQLRTTLFSLRQEVNQAFFAAAMLQARDAELAATVRALEGRLREAATRVRERAALPSDTAALLATILQRRVDQLQLRADRQAALARLALLTGRPIPDDAALALPDLATTAAAAQRALATLRERPEFAQFAAARERLARQARVQRAAELPRLSAFGRAGYGKPGLNFLSNGFDTYWLAGVQLQWTPFTWGRTTREREVLALQQQIVATNEASFSESLQRAVQGDLAETARLDSALTLDDRVVALREQIERETALRFREGVVTASEYVDRTTDVLSARLARAAHRVELVQARARLLTTLGIEVR